MRMKAVVFQLEIFELELKNRFYLWIEFHLRQRERFASELKLSLLQMICIKMKISESVYKFTGLETRDVGAHHEQQGV